MGVGLRDHDVVVSVQFGEKFKPLATPSRLWKPWMVDQKLIELMDR